MTCNLINKKFSFFSFATEKNYFKHRKLLAVIYVVDLLKCNKLVTSAGFN